MRPCDYGIDLSICVSELNTFTMAEGSSEYTGLQVVDSKHKRFSRHQLLVFELAFYW